MLWVFDVTALLKPELKLELNVVGALPKPVNPEFVSDAKPLLNPPLKVLVLNCELNEFRQSMVGRLMLI